MRRGGRKLNFRAGPTATTLCPELIEIIDEILLRSVLYVYMCVYEKFRMKNKDRFPQLNIAKLFSSNPIRLKPKFAQSYAHYRART